MERMPYGFSVDVAAGHEAARRRVAELLKEEGFGILTEIDVRQTLRQKLDEDFRPYRILGACNPRLAHRALQVEPGIGLLLPCNVVVEALSGDASRVWFMDAVAAMGLVGNVALEPVAAEANERLRRVADRLGSGGRRPPGSVGSADAGRGS
jgi:uncharacterized protein (DUF302 family)